MPPTPIPPRTVAALPWHRRQFLAGGAGLALSAAASPALAQLAPPRTRLIAFVCGIDRYTRIKPLERAVADARAIAEAMAGFGYEVITAFDGDTNLLLDRFAEFRGRLEAGAASFLYYAGHGIQVAQTNFLLPADVDASTGDSLLETAVQVDSLLGDIAARSPSQSIVILDACRNDPLPLDVPGKADGYTSTNAPGGFFVGYSAGRGEYALDRLGDDDTHRNGLFTRCLLDQLVPDAPIYDIVKAAGEDVILAARAIGHAQHPAVYDQTARQVRLDAQPGPPRRKPRKTAGRLDGCGALLIGLQRYGEYSSAGSLVTPYTDCAKIERDLAAMGAEVTTLLEPTKARIEQACRELAAAGHARRIVFFSGQGGLVQRESVMVVRSEDAVYRQPASAETRGLGVGIAAPGKPAPTGPSSATDSDRAGMPPGLDLLSATELVAALRDPAGDTGTQPSRRGIGRAAMTSWGKDTFVFIDTCLDDIGIPAPPGGGTGSILDAVRGGDIDGLAFMFAASPMQNALDAAPGKQSSAFAIGICNALGQPGMTLDQFADSVRSEVEVLTDRFQTPLLLASHATRGKVVVDLAL